MLSVSLNRKVELELERQGLNRDFSKPIRDLNFQLEDVKEEIDALGRNSPRRKGLIARREKL